MRLVLLDFVLGNQDLTYFETEQEKVNYFCHELGISKDHLPATVYEGTGSGQKTIRYFVDKFPLEQYATLFLLAAASGLPCSELLALRVDDLDFKTSTIRVEESSDQRSNGKIGPCKNATAYRTVLLRDAKGQTAMRHLRQFLNRNGSSGTALVFHSKSGGPLLETTILNQGLYPAMEAL